MAGGGNFPERTTIQSDKDLPASAAVVASGGPSMAGRGQDPRPSARVKREDEVAETAAAVPSGGSSREITAATVPADPRARASRKGEEDEAASCGNFMASVVEDPQGRASMKGGKRRRDEEVAAAAPQRAATVDDSPPSVKRRLHERLSQGAPEEEEPISFPTPPSSEVVRARDVLSLPENLRAQIMRSLPRQMAMWQLHHQPASFRFQLRDGLYPSPDELAMLLDAPELINIRRFSIVVRSEKVTNAHMAGYLSRVSQCHNEELRLEYHESVDSIYIFHLAECETCLIELYLKNITVSHDSLPATPMFMMMSVLHLSSVRIDSRSLTRVVSLCPSLNTLRLQHINLLTDIVFEAPVSVLRSLTIIMCSNVTELDLQELCSLRSFFYLGPLASMNFCSNARVEDMFLCSRDEEFPGDPVFEWLESAPDFSRLTVLTLSSSFLHVLSSGNVSNLRLDTLRELQVIFVSLDSAVRGQLSSFLRITCCTNLERLFLQLGQSNCQLDLGQEDPLADWEIDLRSLSLIKAEGFSGNNDQMLLLSALLLKVPTLDNLVLLSTCDQGSLQMKVSFLKELSENAEVLLIQDDRLWPQPRHLMPSHFHSRAGG